MKLPKKQPVSINSCKKLLEEFELCVQTRKSLERLPDCEVKQALVKDLEAYMNPSLVIKDTEIPYEPEEDSQSCQSREEANHMHDWHTSSGRPSENSTKLWLILTLCGVALFLWNIRNEIFSSLKEVDQPVQVDSSP
jgi:hypothetical protein